MSGVGSSPTLATCETSHVLLVGVSGGVETSHVLLVGVSGGVSWGGGSPIFDIQLNLKKGEKKHTQKKKQCCLFRGWLEISDLKYYLVLQNGQSQPFILQRSVIRLYLPDVSHCELHHLPHNKWLYLSFFIFFVWHLINDLKLPEKS